MSGIIIANFLKDGRIFAKSNTVAMEQQPTLKQQGTSVTEDGTGVITNYVLERNNGSSSSSKNSNRQKDTDNTPSTSKAVSTTSKISTTSGTDIEDNDDNKKDENSKGIWINVVNYTGNTEVAMNIKNKLEAAGYVVNLYEETPDWSINTSIIEHTENASGQKIRDIILGGTVQIDHSTESQIDATVIIGADMLP